MACFSKKYKTSSKKEEEDIYLKSVVITAITANYKGSESTGHFIDTKINSFKVL